MWRLLARITSDAAEREEEDNAEESGDGAASLAENRSATDCDWSPHQKFIAKTISRMLGRVFFSRANPNSSLSASYQRRSLAGDPPFRRGKMNAELFFATAQVSSVRTCDAKLIWDEQISLD